MKKGAVTVFLAMSLPIVLILIFTLIESARSAGIRAVTKASGNAAVNSLFGAYNRTLFDEYGLLFFDGGYGGGLLSFESIEEEFTEHFNRNEIGGNLLFGGSFFPVEVVETKVTDVVTATDYNGEILIRSALDYFKFDFAGEMLENVLDCVKGIKDGEKAKGKSDSDSNVLDGTDWSKYAVGTASRGNLPSVKTMGLISRDGKAVFTSDPVPEDEPERIDDKKLKSNLKDSAIGSAERSKASGWLSLVLPSEVTVSEYEMKEKDLPSRVAVDDRGLERRPSILEDGLKRITFCEYLLRHFTNYSNEQATGGPAYEVEYILFGHTKDRKNFETALNRIMWVREGVNLVYLLASEKREEAKAAAMLIVGWTGNPIIIELTTGALLAAWAYAEAILDVRGLLQRKRVPFFKTDDNWTLSFGGIKNLLAGGSEAVKESKSGLCYEDYLRIFLYLSDVQEGAYRAMDLIQSHMQRQSPTFMMASQIYAAEIMVTVYARELFTALPMFRKNRLELNGYVFEERFSEVY